MKTEYFIFASIMGWGLGSFLYKLATNTISPIMMSTIALSEYVILLPFLWAFIKFDHTLTTGGVVYALVGSVCMCIGTLGFSYALRLGGGAGKITVLCAMYPALTLMLSMLFLKETITIKQSIGIVLALVSFVMMSLK
jgi:bacterial/archaeal transporter family protein